MGLALAVALPSGGCGSTGEEQAGGGAMGSSSAATQSAGSRGSGGGTSMSSGSGGWDNAAISVYGSGPSYTFVCDSMVTTHDMMANVCLSEVCCTEFVDCASVSTQACQDCIDRGGGDVCDAALTCWSDRCPREDLGICHTSFSTSDEQLDRCIGDACCDEYVACGEAGGATCRACFENGGGSVCDAALACQALACGYDSCSRGVTSGSADVDICRAVYCCADLVECNQAGEDSEGCMDCLDEGGGPRCDDLLACDAANDCTDGGAGGGGVGGRGAGGAATATTGSAGGSGGSGGSGGIGGSGGG